jgi:predicted nucleotidyltransferase
MSEAMLVDVRGVEDDMATACLELNKIGNAERGKLEKDEKADTTTFDQNKMVLCMTLDSIIQNLRTMKTVIEQLESAEEKDYLDTLVLPPTECQERIHRAEAAMERRFYKALHYLLAMQANQLPR